MTTIFFPAFNIAKGFGWLGFRPGGGGDDVFQGSIRWRNDSLTSCSGGEDCVSASGGASFGALAAARISENACRLRGTGGGSSGRMSKRFESSDRVGIGVVRASTTTTEKSGAGGADFLNGVDGLYTLKTILYGDVSFVVLVLVFEGVE